MRRVILAIMATGLATGLAACGAPPQVPTASTHGHLGVTIPATVTAHPATPRVSATTPASTPALASPTPTATAQPSHAPSSGGGGARPTPASATPKPTPASTPVLTPKPTPVPTPTPAPGPVQSGPLPTLAWDVNGSVVSGTSFSQTFTYPDGAYTTGPVITTSWGNYSICVTSTVKTETDLGGGDITWGVGQTYEACGPNQSFRAPTSNGQNIVSEIVTATLSWYPQ